MTKEIRSFSDLTIRTDDEKKTAAGIAAPFNSDSVDFGDWVERIERGAFQRSIAASDAGEINIFALWSHDTSQPLGSTRADRLTLTETDEGLRYEADISRMSPIMRGALEDGDLGVSIGFNVREYEWERVEVGDQTRYVRTLLDVDLLEISFVTHPAYADTSAALRDLNGFKSEFRAKDNIDTSEQLKRVLFLQHRIRSAD